MNTAFNLKKVIFILVLTALIFAGYLFYKDNYTENLISVKNNVENNLLENSTSSSGINSIQNIQNIQNTQNTQNTSDKLNVTNKTPNQTQNNITKSGYTLADVAKHDTAKDC
jgi:hypothetical protein